MCSSDLVKWAVSDQRGHARMLSPTDGCDAWSSLATPVWGSEFHEELVPTVTLDDFVEGLLGKSPTMIKIDVEGWESRVIQGGSKLFTLARCPLLQVEFTDENAISAGTTCEKLFELLTELDFEVCHYDSALNQLVPESIRPAYPYVNLYASRHLALDNQKLCSGN